MPRRGYLDRRLKACGGGCGDVNVVGECPVQLVLCRWLGVGFLRRCWTGALTTCAPGFSPRTVNGKGLQSLHYAVERRDQRCLVAMGLYGGPEDWDRLQQVWKACRHLEICAWTKREWVRVRTT